MKNDYLKELPKQEIPVVEKKEDDFERRIEKLMLMKNAGLITDEEFNAKKKELLDSI